MALDFLAGWPYPVAFGTLFLIVLLRAGATTRSAAGRTPARAVPGWSG